MASAHGVRGEGFTTAWAGRLPGSNARSAWGLGLPLRGSLLRAGVGVGETTAEGLLQLLRTAGFAELIPMQLFR